MTEQEQKVFLKKISEGRRFGFLPILDCYIFREFMIPFSILCFTFTLLFLIGDIFNDLTEFLEYKGSNAGALALKYFLMKMPGNIRFVLPISVLLSCMYTVANLGRCREITAMRASGISMTRCGGAIFAVAFIVTIVNFWFNEQLVPDCSMSAEILIHKLSDPEYDSHMYNLLQYRSPDKKRDWFFQGIDEHGVGHGIILKKFEEGEAESAKRVPVSKIEAESAFYKEPSQVVDGLTPEQQKQEGWVFLNARRYGQFNRISNIPTKRKDEFKLLFDPEVRDDIDSIRNAVKPSENLSSADIIAILASSQQLAPTVKSTYETLLYYRLAFPWVCFLCVFLGLPLSVKNERSGIFLSIVTAVAAIVIFQMMTEVFLVLGKQGYIPPVIGGVGPTAAFLFYSYFFVIRKTC